MFFTVTNSLAALSRGLVFCTEPFRIPFAGKLDVLCFDKTGTLTMDKMVLKGVVGSPESSGETEEQQYSISALLAVQESGVLVSLPSKGSDNEEVPSTKAITVITEPSSPACAEISLSIMAACHSLLVAPESGVIVGDPLETATMDSSGFQFIRSVGKIINLGAICCLPL